MESDTQQEIPDILYTYKKINDNTYHQILNGYLWASSPTEFNDIFDCCLHYQIVPALMGVLKKKKDTYFNRRLINDILFRQRIICFTDNPKNSTMWAHYSENISGVCIGWRIKDIKNNIYKVSYASNLSEMIGKYANNIPNMGNPLSIEKILEHVDALKLDSWAYENEFRYIKTNTKENIKNIIPCKIDSIIFGIYTTDKAKNIIYHLAINNNPDNQNIKFYQLSQDKEKLLLNMNPCSQDNYVYNLYTC